VGQAGKPKQITGFQTHTSPVILAAGERLVISLFLLKYSLRAELASEEYEPISNIILENFVILKKSQNMEIENEQKKKK